MVGETDGERELLATFVTEAKGRIAAIVADLESDPDADTVESLRREAHTLKGTAGVLGQQQVFDIAARLERELTSAADGPIPPPQRAAAREAAQDLEDAVNSIE